MEYCKKLPNIKLLGLMTMAPYTENEEIIRNSFKKLSELKNKLIENGFELQHLSCLLYTSPSPRDRTRSRMPSSA